MVEKEKKSDLLQQLDIAKKMSSKSFLNETTRKKFKERVKDLEQKIKKL